MGQSISPVLVIDDDRQVQEIIRLALEQDGLVVDTAADQEEALALAAANRPALVVLDIKLFKSSGFEVAAALRAEHGEELPILTITSDGHAAEKASKVGSYAYLEKPFDLTRLVAAVRQGLGDQGLPIGISGPS